MKKIFLSSLSLLAFSASIILFQISCKKEAKADTTTTSVTSSQQNKILYYDQGNQHSNFTYWIMNYDGTGAQKINIVPPAGLTLGSAQISPDGKTVFVTLTDVKSNFTIYACNTDGSNLHLVTAGSSSTSTTNAGATIAQAY